MNYIQIGKEEQKKILVLAIKQKNIQQQKLKQINKTIYDWEHKYHLSLKDKLKLFFGFSCPELQRLEDEYNEANTLRYFYCNFEKFELINDIKMSNGNTISIPCKLYNELIMKGSDNE